MTPVERAVAHMEARRDDYGHVPVPYRVLLDSIPSELLHAIADERRMVADPTMPRSIP